MPSYACVIAALPGLAPHKLVVVDDRIFMDIVLAHRLSHPADSSCAHCRASQAHPCAGLDDAGSSEGSPRVRRQLCGRQACGSVRVLGCAGLRRGLSNCTWKGCANAGTPSKNGLLDVRWIAGTVRRKPRAKGSLTRLG